MKVLLLNSSIQHFGRYSGYDRMFDFLKEDIDFIYNDEQPGWLKRKFINRKLWPSYDQNKYGPYHYYSKYVEEYLAFNKALRTNPDVIHFTFAEDSLGYFSDVRSKLPGTIKLVGSVHQPPSWWKMTNKNIQTLKCLDALIVLSQEAKNYFETYLPNKVHFLPHGVDTGFFVPANRKENRSAFKCLFVGNWLRDFTYFVDTVHRLNATYSNIEFNIVYPHQPEPTHPLFQLIRYDNINWYRNISDEQLLHLYQQVDVLFLPLLNCTANNALLEAASCYLPVITTQCGGVNDYFPDDLIYSIKKNNMQETMDIFGYLLHPENKMKIAAKSEQLGKLVREKFDFKVVAHKLHSLYTSL
jgi:glycosyltransferase involved in cell wall biosynthesis